jgi:GDPmannose 4,6-dehydratase
LSIGKCALITGVTGQDGAYLAKLLLDKGYRVFGAARRTSDMNGGRLEGLGIAKDIERVDFDLLELASMLRTMERTGAEEVYNLAAQSFVGYSFEQPIYTSECNGIGVARVLEAIRTVNPSARFFQASTSEMFGRARENPQCETTPFHPCSPYGASKAYGHYITTNYREAHGLHASSGIMFNHESTLRGLEFVTRKITTSLARIKHGKLDVLELGNLNARRDWGFAPEYVSGMWLMLQQPAGGDYVLATGEMHSVREFVQLAGEAIGLSIGFQSSGSDEYGVDQESGRTIVKVNSALYRPAEVDALCGNAAKAERDLAWKATTTFSQLVALMAEADDRRVHDKRIFQD